MSAHKSGRIPRPANSFILFRSDVGQSSPGTNGRDISRVAAEKWNTSPESVKASYSKQAQEEKAKHAIMYPDYQYRPSSKKGSSKGDSLSSSQSKPRSKRAPLPLSQPIYNALPPGMATEMQRQPMPPLMQPAPLRHHEVAAFMRSPPATDVPQLTNNMGYQHHNSTPHYQIPPRTPYYVPDDIQRESPDLRRFHHPSRAAIYSGHNPQPVVHQDTFRRGAPTPARNTPGYFDAGLYIDYDGRQ